MLFGMTVLLVRGERHVERYEEMNKMLKKYSIRRKKIHIKTVMLFVMVNTFTPWWIYFRHVEYIFTSINILFTMINALYRETTRNTRLLRCSIKRKNKHIKTLLLYAMILLFIRIKINNPSNDCWLKMPNKVVIFFVANSASRSSNRQKKTTLFGIFNQQSFKIY